MIFLRLQIWPRLRIGRGVVGAGLLMLSVLWLLPSTAGAQVDENDEESVGAPVRLLPRRSQEEKTQTKPPSRILVEEAEAEARVLVSPLQALDPSSVGLIGADDGGFGPGLWAGSERAQIETLLARIPVGTVSRAMQRLTRRLLVSAAPVPAGEPTVPSLLGLRVERLAAGGDIEAAGQLAALAPPQLVDPLLARIEADGLLLTGDNSGACARVESQVASGNNEPYWIKRLSFCRALNGELAAARLAADLLRELGETADDAFFTLVAALGGDPSSTVVSLVDPTALHLAMLRAAGQNVPADSVPGASPAILRAIATAPNTELEVRLQAAEAAEAVGALKPSALAQIYASVIFSPEDTASAIAIATENPGPRSNALLFQVTQIQTVPTAKGEALRAAWQVARKKGDFETSARVNLATVRSFTVAPDLAWFAGDAGLALLAADDVEAAREWFNMARDTASEREPDAAKAVLDLLPLMQIAEQRDPLPWLPAIVRPWWQGQQDLPETVRLEKVSLIYTVFEAFGFQVPADDWFELVDGPLSTGANIPAPAAWRGMREAAAAGRVGETVLYALLILGEGGPAVLNPLALEGVIGALRLVGLESDARAIAVEAVLARTL